MPRDACVITFEFGPWQWQCIIILVQLQDVARAVAVAAIDSMIDPMIRSGPNLNLRPESWIIIMAGPNHPTRAPDLRSSSGV